MSDPLWYKNAVFYEVYVRAFYDSNGDGHGDLNGLTQKLDYLQSLGVDCLWLLPIYPSPLKDDGYDISDYTSIHADYGTLDDFKALLAAAHARNIRLIMDLVINHTSDQHPWFQAARSERDSPYRALLCLERFGSKIQQSAYHFCGHRKIELDLGRICRSILLAPVLQQPARPKLRQPGSTCRDPEHHPLLVRTWGGRFPGGCSPVSLRTGRNQPAKTYLRRTPFSRKCADSSIKTIPGESCYAKPTNGRKTCALTWERVTSFNWLSIFR